MTCSWQTYKFLLFSSAKVRPRCYCSGIFGLSSSVNLLSSYTFVSPSAFSRRAVVSYWRKYVHEVLVNRLGGLSLPRKSVVRLTDRPDMTLDVDRGRKTTMQQVIWFSPVLWQSAARHFILQNSCLSFISSPEL